MSPVFPQERCFPPPTLPAALLLENLGHDEPGPWRVLAVTRAETLTPIMPWVRTSCHWGL